MLAEMERNTSEAVGVSDDGEEEEEPAGKKRRSDWNKTSDSRNFEDSVMSTEPTEKTAKDEDMPQWGDLLRECQLMCQIKRVHTFAPRRAQSPGWRPAVRAALGSAALGWILVNSYS